MSEVYYSSKKFKKNCRQGTAATPDEDVTHSEVKIINPTASNTVCHCGSAEHSGQSSYPYRRVAVCLGLLCALLLAAAVVLCVLYTSLSENYSMLERDLEELRSNYSTMNTSLSENDSMMERDLEELRSNYSTMSNVSNPCLQGWAQLSSKCYYFSNETKSWEDSHSDCVKRGADLVIIESVKEECFIYKQIKNSNWIGLSYSVDYDNGPWVTGTPTQEGYWESGEPGGKNGFACAQIGPWLNGWVAFNCSDKHNFICETKLY